MKEKVKGILEQIDFAARYIKLCNQFADYDHAMNFNKEDIEEVLNHNEGGFKYSSKEKLFSKDYLFAGFNLRFVIGFKYGFIDGLYAFWSNDEATKLRGGFGTISTIQDPDFESKVAYKFPIASSREELELILNTITQLHHDFISHLEKKDEL